MTGTTTLRILLIEPLSRDSSVARTRRLAQQAVGPSVDVTVRNLPDLPPSAYLPAEDVLLSPLLTAVRVGHDDGFDAIGVACASDPGVREAKALVSTPVTGPFESAARLAACFGRLSVLYPGVTSGPGENLPQDANWIRRLAHDYGIGHLLGRSFPVPVDRPEIEVGTDGWTAAADEAVTSAQVADNMTEAITERGPQLARRAHVDHDAECLFVACTIWADNLGPIRQAVPIPVIDPIAALARQTALLAATAAG